MSQRQGAERLRTAREVKELYDARFQSLIASDAYQPLIFPWFLTPFILVIVYLLLDHRESYTLRILRFPLFTFVLGYAVWGISTLRGRSPAAGYGVGLTYAWGTLWTASIMMLNDSQKDFQRIEQRNGASVADGNVSQTHAALKAVNGPAFYWQSFPSGSFSARLSWVLDLFISFRGIGWTFQVTGIPPAPKFVEDSLRGTLDNTRPSPALSSSIPPYTVSPLGQKRYTNRSSLAWAILPPYLLKLVLLDFIKLQMRHDPYFYGYGSISSTPAPDSLPSIVRDSASLLKLYRLLLAILAVHTLLTSTFYLGPLVFSLILGVIPATKNILGLRGEPWMNPPSYFNGDFEPIFTHGLAGFWGGFWHQVFRFGFEAPCTAILTGLGLSKRSLKGRVIALTCAFGLSGVLHACGSYTQLGDTNPLAGAWAFFALQGVGCMVQGICVQGLAQQGTLEKLPMVLKRWLNFGFVLAWLYFTAPLLVDDFSQGGAWLYEPLPFSPLMALGWGREGDESPWLLWKNLIYWRQGERWWQTGLAL